MKYIDEDEYLKYNSQAAVVPIGCSDIVDNGTMDIFNVDTNMFSVIPYKPEMGIRFRNLYLDARKTFKDDGVNINLKSILSWVLLNFSSKRARKHFEVETAHWHVSKLEGEDVINFMCRTTGRFSRYHITSQYVASLLCELYSDVRYINNPNMPNAMKLYNYLFGVLLFDDYVFERIGRNSYSSKATDNFVYKHNTEGSNVSVKFDFDFDGFMANNITFDYGIYCDENRLSNVEGCLHINEFEYNGKVFNISESYNACIKKFNKNAARYIVNCFDIFIHYTRRDSCRGTDYRGTKYYFDLLNVVDSVNKFDDEISYDIDKFEEYIKSCKEEMKFLDEISGCGMLIGMR